VSAGTEAPSLLSWGWSLVIGWLCASPQGNRFA
jgi:hypothetical protein